MSAFTPFSFILISYVLAGVYCHSAEDHKAWRFIKDVLMKNDSIVTKKLKAHSLLDCSTKCSGISSTASLYYESTHKLCYCNHGLDLKPIISPAGILLYGYASLSYVAEKSVDGEKILTSRSPEACQELIHKAYTDGHFDHYPDRYHPRNSLYTYCHQYLYNDWVVFQRRQDGSINFTRPWNDYLNGFGDISNGEFWLGLKNIFHMTSNNNCELNVTVQVDSYNPSTFGYAYYARFSLSGETDGYRLNVSGFIGTVGDCLSAYSGNKFSTFDKDHDILPTVNCATILEGGWWYGNCDCCSLNGMYPDIKTRVYRELVWTMMGRLQSPKKVEMKIRCLLDKQ